MRPLRAINKFKLMSYFFSLPRRRHLYVFGVHVVGNSLGVGKTPEYLRGGLLLSPVANRVPGQTRMGFCACIGESFQQTFKTIFNAAKLLGRAVCKCLGHCCMCSDCLPSSEAVGSCFGRFLALVFLAVCCPCFCCYCICKAIVLFRRRKRDQDPEDQSRRGYNTFDNDSSQQDYLERRDDLRRDDSSIKNYLFYSNEIVSEPRGARIDNILIDWYGKYDLLENHHGFIQWLFPLYEPGVNSYASPLTLDERQLILNDHAAMQRMRSSCRLMLDFYGIDFDEVTEQLTRNANYKDRFYNLNRHSHNNLRISRIVKCLVIFNYCQLAKSIVKFFITEICREGNLPGCRRSCKDFWIPALHPDDVFEMESYYDKLEKEAEKMRYSRDLMVDDEPMIQVDESGDSK